MSSVPQIPKERRPEMVALIQAFIRSCSFINQSSFSVHSFLSFANLLSSFRTTRRSDGLVASNVMLLNEWNDSNLRS